MDGTAVSRAPGSVSIVIPAYNTGPVVAEVVSDIRAGLGKDVQVIVVDDGSVEAVAQWLDDSVEVVRLVQNSGKGAALRAGFARATGEVVGYIDGDGELDAHALAAMVDKLRGGGCDGVLGDRGVLGTRSLVRRAGTVAFGLWVQYGLGLPRDLSVGVGAKVFWGDQFEAAMVFGHEDGYAFDAEVLAILVAQGHGQFCSVPILYRPSGTTTLSARRLLGEVGSVNRIRARVKKLR